MDEVRRAIQDEYDRDPQADDQYRAGLAFALERIDEYVTGAHVREWLDRQADRWMEHGEFTSDVPAPGVNVITVSAPLSVSKEEDPLWHLRPSALTFTVTWHGAELTTTRDTGATRGERSSH